MAWKDRLRPASFRQAAFGVEAHSSEQGRRVVVHEYPGRDKPYVEDLGAKARGFTLRGFVVGKDYQQARDALLDAANAPGPGQLVHPYFGVLRVVCTAVSVSESGEAGGMAVFDLTFVEAGESRYPAAETDPAGSLLDAADTLDGQLAEAFGKWFDLDGLPDFLSRDNLQALTERIQRLSTVGGLLDLSKQSPFLRQVRQLLDAVGELSAAPAVFGSRIIGLTHAGAQQAATPLVLGGNIKSGTADYDYSERFSEYTITGQRAGKDNDHGKAAAHVRSAVRDEAIKRHRPFAKSADGQATPEMARRQAEWEKQVRCCPRPKQRKKPTATPPPNRLPVKAANAAASVLGRARGKTRYPAMCW